MSLTHRAIIQETRSIPRCKTNVMIPDGCGAVRWNGDTCPTTKLFLMYICFRLSISRSCETSFKRSIWKYGESEVRRRSQSTKPLIRKQARAVVTRQQCWQINKIRVPSIPDISPDTYTQGLGGTCSRKTLATWIDARSHKDIPDGHPYPRWSWHSRIELPYVSPAGNSTLPPPIPAKTGAGESDGASHGPDETKCGFLPSQIYFPDTNLSLSLAYRNGVSVWPP